MARNAKPITDADRFEQVLDLSKEPMTYHDVQYTLNLSAVERRKLDNVLKNELVPNGKRFHLIDGDKPKLLWGCDRMGLPDQPVPAWAIPLITYNHMKPTSVPVPNFEAIVNDVEISQQWEFIKERAGEIDDGIVQRQVINAIAALLTDFVNGKGGARDTLRMMLGATLELVGHVLSLQSSNRSLKAIGPMHERLLSETEKNFRLEMENQRLRLTHQETEAPPPLRIASQE